MSIRQREEGCILGTRGVILTDRVNYHNRTIDVGWHVANDKIREVDYVGHSWFVKREYLSWMLSKPYGHKYKYAAEDMTLSFAGQEHGVKTFVPAHPRNIIALWGSIPSYGWNYGTDTVALSGNSENLIAMNNALKDLHADGWKFLFERNSDYVNFMDTERNFNDLRALTHQMSETVAMLLKLVTKRQSIFMGERKYLPHVQRLFDITPQEYFVLEDDNRKINLRNVLGRFRWHSIHIFFTDVYSQIKPHIEQAHWTENADFIDGRILLRFQRQVNS